jgi:hypothetical protein
MLSCAHCILLLSLRAWSRNAQPVAIWQKIVSKVGFRAVWRVKAGPKLLLGRRPIMEEISNTACINLVKVFGIFLTLAIRNK